MKILLDTLYALEVGGAISGSDTLDEVQSTLETLIDAQGA